MTAPASASDYRSIKEAAAFFEVADKTLEKWIADGCPVVEGGRSGIAYKLDLRAIHDWRQGRIAADTEEKAKRAARDQQLKLALLGPDAVEAGEKTALSPKERAETLAAEINRIKLEELRGELVRAVPVRLEIAEACRSFRDRLLALPDEMAREFGLSDDQVNAMHGKVEAALNDLADEQERRFRMLTQDPYAAAAE